jgi:hypothetical protein
VLTSGGLPAFPRPIPQVWALQDAVWAAEAARHRFAERFRRCATGMHPARLLYRKVDVVCGKDLFCRWLTQF